MSTLLHTQQRDFKTGAFEERIEGFSASSLEAFKQITRQYALFHVLFFAIGILELFAFVLFFSFLTKSTIFAFTIAGLFFTGFAYFVLLFYFQAKKPEQLLDVRNGFVEQCKAALPFQEGQSEYHLSQAHALYYLLTELDHQEYSYYKLPESFETLSILAQKFSVWTHWKDVHQMKEVLLHMIIREYVKLVQLKPTDLEIHSGLANTFYTLSRLYLDPRKTSPEKEHLWVSPDYNSAAMFQKFKRSAMNAVEELRILDAYAPNDPWVHSRLAAIYQDLGMIDEEINEYELILALSPKDSEILFRLGVLYFSQGQNGRALRLYEKLKGVDPTKAEELLTHYGAMLNDPV